MFTYTKLHTSSYYSAEDVCISRLVKLELLLDLKFEQKHSTSLVKLVLSRRKSALPSVRGPDVCPSQLHILNNALGFAQTSPLREGPLSLGILDMFLFKKLYHVSILVSKFI
jgi:hypothetical protein